MFTQALLHILTWASYCSLEIASGAHDFLSKVSLLFVQKPLLRVKLRACV